MKHRINKKRVRNDSHYIPVLKKQAMTPTLNTLFRMGQYIQMVKPQAQAMLRCILA